MGKNIMSELIGELSQRVGGEDVARGIVEGMRTQKGATRSSIQKQVRSLIRNIDTDDITRKTSYLDKFTTDKEGQVVFKNIDMPEPPVVEPEIPIIQKDVSGQMSMFQDSTGEMTTSALKTRQIKEARQARIDEKAKTFRNNDYKKQQFTLDDDGQIRFDFPELKQQAASKQGAAINESGNGRPTVEEYEKKIEQLKKKPASSSASGNENAMPETPGQEHLLNGDDGLTYSDAVIKEDGYARRLSEMYENEKGFVRKSLDKTKEIGSRAVEAITGEGDDVSRLFGGRKTRNEQRMAANDKWLRTGEGNYQSKKQYYKNVKNQSSNRPAYEQKLYQDIITGESVNEQNLAKGISQTAALDNSGIDFGIPTWGKVAIGVGAGWGISTLLDNDGY